MNNVQLTMNNGRAKDSQGVTTSLRRKSIITPRKTACPVATPYGDAKSEDCAEGTGAQCALLQNARDTLLRGGVETAPYGWHRTHDRRNIFRPPRLCNMPKYPTQFVIPYKIQFRYAP